MRKGWLPFLAAVLLLALLGGCGAPNQVALGQTPVPAVDIPALTGPDAPATQAPAGPQAVTLCVNKLTALSDQAMYYFEENTIYRALADGSQPELLLSGVTPRWMGALTPQALYVLIVDEEYTPSSDELEVQIEPSALSMMRINLADGECSQVAAGLMDTLLTPEGTLYLQSHTDHDQFFQYDFATDSMTPLVGDVAAVVERSGDAYLSLWEGKPCLIDYVQRKQYPIEGLTVRLDAPQAFDAGNAGTVYAAGGVQVRLMFDLETEQMKAAFLQGQKETLLDLNQVEQAFAAKDAVYVVCVAYDPAQADWSVPARLSLYQINADGTPRLRLAKDITYYLGEVNLVVEVLGEYAAAYNEYSEGGGIMEKCFIERMD